MKGVFHARRLFSRCRAAAFLFPATFIFLIFSPVVLAREGAEPLRAAALGDSIAQGYGCRPEEAYGRLLADRLAEELDGTGTTVSFANYGVDGLTSGGLRAMIETDEIQAVAANADLVTVSIGGNDLLYCLREALGGALALDPDSSAPWQELLGKLQEENRRETVSSLLKLAGNGDFYRRLNAAADDMLNNVEAVLDALSRRNPEAVLLLTTIPPPTVDPPLNLLVDAFLFCFNSRLQTVSNPAVRLADCSQAFRSYAGEEALTFTVAGWSEPSGWNPDPHPTPAGHRLMAETHLPLVQDLIADRRAAAPVGETAPSETPESSLPAASSLPDATGGLSAASEPADLSARESPRVWLFLLTGSLFLYLLFVFFHRLFSRRE